MNQRDNLKYRYLSRATEEINASTDLAFDVATHCGFMFSFIRRFPWFQLAVAQELLDRDGINLTIDPQYVCTKACKEGEGW